MRAARALPGSRLQPSAGQKQLRVARSSAPYIYVLAGPNGSGKSTLAAQLRVEIPGAPKIWINADEIAARLRDETPGNINIALAAAIEADRLRHAALDAARDLITETVMSDGLRWVPFFQKAVARGYRIVLYFVTTRDAAINVARVRARVKRGGHDVPEARIRSRYKKVMEEVLPKILPLTYEAYIFDNSESERSDSSPCLIAVYRDGGLKLRAEARNSAILGWLNGLKR